MNHAANPAPDPTANPAPDPTASRCVCAVLTTFNRRELTIASLARLERSARAAGVAPAAVVVDDASQDGTADAVMARFPWATIVHGDGSLFWCRGMHAAFAAAIKHGAENYLWLNDDTLLEESAIRVLLATAEHLAKERGVPVIVVGSTVEPGTARRTYGGESMPSRWRPFRVLPIEPGPRPQRCDSMNGNIVLVPAAAAAAVGNMDPAYEHAMGDTDYALRARRAGVEVWLAPGALGACASNPTRGSHRDRSLPFRRRWQLMLHRKGLPWRSWLHFARRHGGLLWPLHFAWPYVRLVADGLTARPRRAAE